MLNTRINISFIICILSLFACSDKKSIKDNLKDLDQDNYAVLDPYVRNRSAVGLGEDTHGDGELFELKTELIEHLHKKLGFQAVLMESDFLAVEEITGALQTATPHEAARIGVLNTWADSKEYLTFIEYLRSTSNNGDTLYFHGFDSQMTGARSLELHLKRSESLENSISAEAYKNLRAALNIIGHLDVSEVSLDSLMYMRQTIQNDIKKYTGDVPLDEQWIKNIVGNLKILISQKQAPPVTIENIPEVFSHPKYLEAGSIRDSLMADNILYHMKKYDKVIIWAANNHLRFKSNNKDRIWMGEILKSKLEDDYYPILVLYDHGEWSYPNGTQKGSIPEPKKGTLCYEVSRSFSGEVGFLDVRSTQLPQKVVVRDNNWITTDSIHLESFMDGLLYIRKATGSTHYKDNNK